MRYLLIISLAVFLFACESSDDGVNTDMINIPSSASGEGADTKLPEITFDVPEFDYGTIAEGEVVRHNFEFENTGDAPLLISKVESTCGCTVMKDWPKEPIQPGENGEIVVEFNSSKREGSQRKKITVLANTVPTKNLIYMTGVVVGPNSQ
ncbi:DUF1573 domain-containing protein [Sanyastnella coralliicola]|uniref:DUF1573 domain-containing protein n=1 Tax=Sanyastnella coralliicola TaxID=3069118 RepID=UPI0027BB1B15|nr:DUF1573 domain-containing protein [Longitalea sp. SCSIO 12813]